LILALDLGPVTVLRNTDGRFSDATESMGLASHLSQWNGVTTGDVDGDGNLDIVATSWGRNTKFRASVTRPLLLYYSDFDRNGTLDVLQAQFDDLLGEVAPLEENRSVLVDALPYIGRRVPSSRAYADASLSEVVGERLAEADVLSITTYDHAVFLNRGDVFEPVSLPPAAQLAPSFYVGVVDFDGDGTEDLFLTQNFFPTAITTPRYDAGRGLWLRGVGNGEFERVPGSTSGIEVYGDQRGAAFSDFDGDGRVDLAISQNGRETKLYRNERGEPGLRVRLQGGPGNPHAIGAAIHLIYEDRWGPLREVHGGSGYWSLDGPLQVMGGVEGAIAVWVRWPGGETTQLPLEPGQREVTIER
ncbi:MAG: VCBS repeat-containing protein, partial [Gemmatimonadota bacterium]